MFEFKANKSGSIVNVFFGGINLGRIKLHTDPKHLRKLNADSVKYTLIDADKLGLVPGEPMWRDLRLKPRTRNELAQIMKKHYKGRTA